MSTSNPLSAHKVVAMQQTLWRIACLLAGAGGVVFGLWAGAVIVRADGSDLSAPPRRGEALVEMRPAPGEASPASPRPPRENRCLSPEGVTPFKGAPPDPCTDMTYR